MNTCIKCGSSDIKASFGNAKGCSWMIAVVFFYMAFDSCGKGMYMIVAFLGLALGAYLFGKYFHTSYYRCGNCGHKEVSADIN